MGRPANGTKRRTYNTRLIRRNFCYRVEEVAELFGVHRQAVRHWLRDGLYRTDDKRPILIHGGDLIAFLDERQSNRKRKCGAGELYCCACRKPCRPRDGEVTIEPQSGTRLLLTARCERCGTVMKQIGSVRQMERYATWFDVLTTEEARLSGRTEPDVICQLDKENDDAALQPEE